MSAKTEMRKRAVAKREGSTESKMEEEVWIRGRLGGRLESRG